MASDYIELAYANIIAATAPPSIGTSETPRRAADAWRELTSGYGVDVERDGLLRTFREEDAHDMVIVKRIPFYSLCEHHLLPFHGHADVAYLPSEWIIGLSKIARIVDMYARRLQVQERLTRDIGSIIYEGVLDCQGVMVVTHAEHLCMTMRGVEKPGAVTTTSYAAGAFRDNAATRAEALELFRG